MGERLMYKKLITSESVTEGHPDKIADQISDAILDSIIIQDPNARVAVETAVTTGLVFVFGEISTSAYVDIQKIVRQKIAEIGYTDRKYGFDADNVAVLVSLDEQSADIAQGVDRALESRDQVDNSAETLGAGDQGIMFGFASRETESYMPLPIDLSHCLARKLAEVRKMGPLTYLGPDGKTQVTIEYDEAMNVRRIDNIVVSSQHAEEISQEQLHKDIFEHVIKPVCPAEWLDERTKYFINPTGKFVIGGPVGDSGLTGRKIIVDTYGGIAHHGGGAFSGKDATKVDRSASYMARYVAKNIVAAGLADRCEILLSYAIGVAQPTSINVNTFDTGHYSETKIEAMIERVFDLTPQGIIDHLQLRRPIYSQTAAYGHFGRIDLDLPWERLDKVQEIQNFMQKA